MTGRKGQRILTSRAKSIPSIRPGSRISGRKRLKELHRVKGDGGQTTHPHAPTDLPWPNRSVARLMS